MKVNENVLIIPPYISTSWKNITSISVEEKKKDLYLVVILKNGKQIEVPDLSHETIKQIFEYHSKHLEKPEEENRPAAKMGFGFSMPMAIGDSQQMDMLGNAMQHNPAQSNAPLLPEEILEKIAGIAKIIGMDDPHNIPSPVPKCNCIYCQVARRLHPRHFLEEENLDPDVSPQELHFRTWNIQQKSDQVYVVSNPLEEKEQYNVYLGNPLGCTCGKKNCEHIKAVLQS